MLLVSNAQPAAGSPLEMPPDGTIGTTMDNFTFLHYLQRQGGLDLSRAKPAHDALEAEGHTVDRKGDNLQNNVDSGQFTRRHHKEGDERRRHHGEGGVSRVSRHGGQRETQAHRGA